MYDNLLSLVSLLQKLCKQFDCGNFIVDSDSGQYKAIQLCFPSVECKYTFWTGTIVRMGFLTLIAKFIETLRKRLILQSRTHHRSPQSIPLVTFDSSYIAQVYL